MTTLITLAFVLGPGLLAACFILGMRRWARRCTKRHNQPKLEADFVIEFARDQNFKLLLWQEYLIRRIFDGPET